MAVYWKLIKPGDNANWVGMLEDKYDLMSKMVMKPTETLTKTRDDKGSGGNGGTRGERRGARRGTCPALSRRRGAGGCRDPNVCWSTGCPELSRDAAVLRGDLHPTLSGRVAEDTPGEAGR